MYDVFLFLFFLVSIFFFFFQRNRTRTLRRRASRRWSTGRGSARPVEIGRSREARDSGSPRLKIISPVINSCFFFLSTLVYFNRYYSVSVEAKVLYTCYYYYSTTIATSHYVFLRLRGFFSLILVRPPKGMRNTFPAFLQIHFWRRSLFQIVFSRNEYLIFRIYRVWSIRNIVEWFVKKKKRHNCALLTFLGLLVTWGNHETVKNV